MEANLEENRHAEDEEEYILLDLDDVCVQSDIPANASYVLSGLDTEAPILLIGDCLKLLSTKRIIQDQNEASPGSVFTIIPVIQVSNYNQEQRDFWVEIGEYRETIGTCFLFSESDDVPEAVHRDTRPSDANISEDKGMTDSNEEPSKQVKPIASLHKILKFRMS